MPVKVSITSICLTCAMPCANSATVVTEVVAPSAQGTITRLISSGYSSISNSTMTAGYTAGRSYSGIIEFALPAIPDGFKVASASLDLYWYSVDYVPSISHIMTWEMRGYAGNGIVNLADANPGNLLNGPYTATMSSKGAFSLSESGKIFPVDVSKFVSTLYSSRSAYAGFAVLPTSFPSNSGTFAFAFERTGSLGTPSGDPTLTISFVPIPEPSQALMLLCGAVMLVGHRRGSGQHVSG